METNRVNISSVAVHYFQLSRISLELKRNALRNGEVPHRCTFMAI